jgi:DNA-binding SARP family transcriptional activator
MAPLAKSANTDVFQLESLPSPIQLIYPHNHQRNQIIAGYINMASSAYYGVTGEESSVAVLSSQILDALVSQGYTVKKPKSFGEGAEAGKTLAAALSSTVQVLVIDQFDLFKEESSEWLNGLADGLSSKTKIVLSTRRVNNRIFNPLINAGKVTVLNENSMSPSPILDGQERRLEVHAFGQGMVFFEGNLVTHWDGPLTRRLFYFLLDRGPVSRTQIFDAFWPNLPIREATNVFHVTKRKMNETIGVDVTDYSDRHYRIGDNVLLHYDVALFEEALKEADAAFGEDSVVGWQRAISIYRHEFLTHETSNWTAIRRKELREGYAQALISTARVYQKDGQVDQALNHFLRALVEVPMREDLHFQVMRLNAERGDRGAAIAQYELLKRRLHETLGINPGKDATTLYNKLVKQA